MRIALFVTCLTDTLFPQTGRAVLRLLERLGHEVTFPAEQTCCGQMHFNSGYADEGMALMRRFVRVFEEHEVIVCPSGSCTAMVREQYVRMAIRIGDPDAARGARDVSERVLELSELLVDRLGLDDVGARFPHCVTFHPSCHGLRVLGNDRKALRLLRAVRGIDLVELPEAEQCCGFGGTFALKNADTSTAMLTDKVRAILDTGAEVCTAADNSCLMHIDGGLRRQQAGIRTMHIAEILASTHGTDGTG